MFPAIYNELEVNAKLEKLQHHFKFHFGQKQQKLQHYYKKLFLSQLGWQLLFFVTPS